MATILFPLPDHDFDVTEVAVPWKVLTRSGHRVVFATENGATPAADPRLFGGLPFGLGARADAIAHYRELEQQNAFRAPTRWSSLVPDEYDALFLAGGHAPGMKQYLASTALHQFVPSFYALARPVAAICHGVIVLARSIDPRTQRSVLWDRKTTCLPKYMERGAYAMTAWKLGRYYRTYDAYVEDEVRSALRDHRQFACGPLTVAARGSDSDDAPAFVVEDGHYLSARWPGDAYLIAKRLSSMLAPIA